MSAAPSALVACLGEDRPDWHTKIETLVLSVRHLGGTLAGAPIVVHLVGSADEAFTRRMEELGARVVVVEPMDPRLPTSNKLRMLELDHDADVLVMLDCDVAVVGDLGPLLDVEAIRAVPAGKAHLDEGAWARLYERVGLTAPEQRIRTSVSDEVSSPYWNSGVLLLPRSLQAPLREAWARMIDVVFELADGDGALRAFRKDQIPFALALRSIGARVEALPVSCNLTTTQVTPGAVRRRGWGPPFVVHYHRSLDQRGYLQASPDRRIDPLVEQVNRMRAEALGEQAPPLRPVPRRRALGLRVRTHPLYWRAKRARRARTRGRRAGQPGSSKA